MEPKKKEYLLRTDGKRESVQGLGWDIVSGLTSPLLWRLSIEFGIAMSEIFFIFNVSMFVCYRMVRKYSNLAEERRKEEWGGQSWRWQKSDPARLSSQGQELLVSRAIQAFCHL